MINTHRSPPTTNLTLVPLALEPTRAHHTVFRRVLGVQLIGAEALARILEARVAKSLTRAEINAVGNSHIVVRCRCAFKRSIADIICSATRVFPLLACSEVYEVNRALAEGCGIAAG